MVYQVVRLKSLISTSIHVNPKRRDKKKMKILKSKKALSPVVASIILIAVTVAVSIAVAAWMGALTIGFFGGAEELNILGVTFGPANNTVKVEVSNTGAYDIAITEVRVDGTSENITCKTGDLTLNADGSTYTLPKGKSGTLTVSVDYIWSVGETYNIHVKTTKTLFGPYPAEAPT